MREWKDNSKLKIFAKKQEECLNETQKSLDHMIEKGYIKKFWDKKLKMCKYQHTPKGVEWQKRRLKNERMEN